MFGSALRCERFVTDQAEAHGFIENAEDLANLVATCEHYRLDVVKHARFIRFFKHEPPAFAEPSRSGRLTDRAGDKGSHFSRYGPEPVIQ
jgi:hypothetical protein